MDEAFDPRLQTRAQQVGRLFRGERLLLVFIPVVCALCAYIATSQTRTSASVAAIWPANGVLLAGLLLAGHRMMRVAELSATLATLPLSDVAVRPGLGGSVVRFRARRA